MTSWKTIPPWPLALGCAGLVPFVALAGLALAGNRALKNFTGISSSLALMGYGVVIASFLGGIRWGAAMQRPGSGPRDYAVSVLPSLVAWVCLALPVTSGLAALGLVVLALGAIDQDLPARGLAPAWFGTLRRGLSLVAGFSLVAASFA